jgi:3-oxoacyl-[acyl-carrier-protein] synthase-3
VNGNTRYRLANTTMLSITGIEAPVVITSDDIDAQMADTLTRLRIKPGLLERVAGVKERRAYPPDVLIGEAAATAGSKALSEAGVDASDVGVLINTSVSRYHLEPAVSVEVHAGMGLPSSAMSFDITNACMGFVNGLQVAGAMIDSGQVDHAVVVGAEDLRSTLEKTVARMAQPDTTRELYLDQFAALTLGSGAVAAVLGRADEHPEGHRILGGVVRSGSDHHGLCVASEGEMVADGRGLLEHGVALAGDAFDEAKQEWGWDTGMARYVFHQVSKIHMRALIDRFGVDAARVPLTYPVLGNVGPASLPMTLAREADDLLPGDRVLCIGIGSGLNTNLTEIVW